VEHLGLVGGTLITRSVGSERDIPVQLATSPQKRDFGGESHGLILGSLRALQEALIGRSFGRVVVRCQC